MKVLFAILLIVGLAAAVPCPILNNLKAHLLQGVEDIKIHSQQLIEQASAHAEHDIPAFVKDPSSGSSPLIKNLSNDARSVVLTSIADVNKINQNIRTAVSELKKVDPKLVKTPVYPILDNLTQQLIGNVRIARSNVLQQLEKALSQVASDAKALAADPAGVSKTIRDKWIACFNKFVSQGQQYVAIVQQQVKNAIDQIEKQYQ